MNLNLPPTPVQFTQRWKGGVGPQAVMQYASTGGAQDKQGWTCTEPEVALWNILPNLMVHVAKDLTELFVCDNN